MSAKFFCDFCGDEITDLNRIKGSRLCGSVIALGGFKLGFEVIHAKDSVSNSGDWCKYCVIDAVKSLDDRPTHRQDGAQTLCLKGSQRAGGARR
jgi:hypothetical protein